MIRPPRTTARRQFLFVIGLLTCLGGMPYWANAEDSTKSVQLIIDYNDGVQKHFTAIDWKPKMTVMDAMLAAKKHPRGIRFVHKGKGATTLLTAIDNLENKGRGRNWLYRVNGTPGDRSIGIFELKAGDTILWKFEKYQ